MIVCGAIQQFELQYLMPATLAVARGSYLYVRSVFAFWFERSCSFGVVYYRRCCVSIPSNAMTSVPEASVIVHYVKTISGIGRCGLPRRSQGFMTEPRDRGTEG